MPIPLRVYGWIVEEADYELVNIRLKIGYSGHGSWFPKVGINVQSLNSRARGELNKKTSESIPIYS